MGGAKSRVEPIFISPSEDSDRLTELQRKLAESRESEKAAELSAKAANATVQALTDQVETLQAQISRLAQQSHYSATKKAQEQLISKLEEELESTRHRLASMRAKCAKTVQKVRCLSAQSQAESALKVFELKEENNRVAQENARLLEKVRLERGSNSPHQDGTTSEGHLQLVLELSQQVSSLDSELQQAQDTISKLRSQRGAGSSVSMQESKHSMFSQPSEEA